MMIAHFHDNKAIKMGGKIPIVWIAVVERTFFRTMWGVWTTTRTTVVVYISCRSGKQPKWEGFK